MNKDKRQTRKKTKETPEHIIFSNMVYGENCPDGVACEHVCDCDYIAYSDEMLNLNKHVDGQIVAIADMGLWNGRRTGYMKLSSNINSILQNNGSYDRVRYYGDGKDIRSILSHHDGVHYVVYRILREDRIYEKLLSMIYNQKPVSPHVLGAYTRSLYPYVADIYGWR